MLPVREMIDSIRFLDSQMVATSHVNAHKFPQYIVGCYDTMNHIMCRPVLGVTIYGGALMDESPDRNIMEELRTTTS